MEELQQEIANMNVLDGTLNSIIGQHLKGLDKNNRDDDKKSLELCHIGKFITLLENKYSIESVQESPDFIIADSEQNKMGVEHTRIFSEDHKKVEGSIESIFGKAEQEYKSQNPSFKFLINFWLKKIDFPIQKKDIHIFIREIIDVLDTFLATGEIKNNKLIVDISGIDVPHTTLSFYPNPSLYVQGQASVTKDLIENAVKEKEQNLEKYKIHSSLKEQWLLIVIGSLGPSSYEMDELVIKDFYSSFSRVYLMEDFKAKVYRLK